MLLVPNRDGYEVTRKVPSADRDRVLLTRDVRGEHVLLVPGREDVACLDDDGTVRWRNRLPSGESVLKLHADPSRNRMLVQTETSLLALNADTGAQERAASFGKVNDSRQILVRENGDIALTENNALRLLDGDLDDRAPARNVGLSPHQLVETGSGALLMLEDGYPSHVLVLEDDGTPKIEQHDIALHSFATDPHGNLWMIDGGRSDTKNVLRLDAADAHLDCFAVGSDTRAVVPLRDGSFITLDDKLAKPALNVHARDGQRTLRFTFPRDGYLRQMHLSSDERSAWAVLDHYDDTKPSERTLYRLDLTPPSGLERLLPARKASRVYTSIGNGKQAVFVPALLSDGRIAIIKDGGIETLDAAGQPLKTYSSPRQMREDTPLAKICSRRVSLGNTPDPDAPPSIAALVEQLTANRRKASNDSCLDFPMAAGSQDLGVLSALTSEALENGPLDLVLRDEVRLPFPNGGTATLESHRATAETAEGTATFETDENERYTAALPLRLEGRPVLAAGTSEGRLHVYDVATRTDTVFSVGAPIAHVGLDRGAIRAVASDGRVLVYRPLGVPQAIQADRTSQTNPSGIVISETEVRIAGIPIRRNV